MTEQHQQGDARCLPAAIQRLREGVQQQRPDLAPWFDEVLQAALGSFASDMDYIAALDTLVRGLQRAGAGGVIKNSMSMKECPSAFMTAARLNNIAPE
jgi:hypothetical protein